MDRSLVFLCGTAEQHKYIPGHQHRHREAMDRLVVIAGGRIITLGLLCLDRGTGG